MPSVRQNLLAGLLPEKLTAAPPPRGRSRALEQERCHGKGAKIPLKMIGQYVPLQAPVEKGRLLMDAAKDEFTYICLEGGLAENHCLRPVEESR